MIFKTIDSDNIHTNSFQLIAGNENERNIYFTKISTDYCKIDNKINKSIRNKNYGEFKHYLNLKIKSENEFVTR